MFVLIRLMVRLLLYMFYGCAMLLVGVYHLVRYIRRSIGNKTGPGNSTVAPLLASGVSRGQTGRILQKYFNLQPSRTASASQYIGRHDPLWGTALVVVAAAGQASPTLLEHRMGIDYARAVELIRAMEAEGHIGPARSGVPRAVFIRREDLTR